MLIFIFDMNIILGILWLLIPKSSKGPEFAVQSYIPAHRRFELQMHSDSDPRFVSTMLVFLFQSEKCLRPATPLS